MSIIQTFQFKMMVLVCSIFGLVINNLRAQNEPIDHSITSEAYKYSPSDRIRTTLGIGEDVKLTLVPDHKATWTISGGGKIDNGNEAVPGKSSVKFTAPDDASSPGSPIKIKAICDDDGEEAEISFTVLAPSGVDFDPVGTTYKTKTPKNLGIRLTADVYILPSGVNFEKVKIKEDKCSGVGTLYYANKSDQHPASTNWITMAGHLEGLGTMAVAPDTIPAGTTGPPYGTGGTFTWSIPWRYQINGVDKGGFATIDHVETLTVGEGRTTLKIQKGIPPNEASDEVFEP